MISFISLSFIIFLQLFHLGKCDYILNYTNNYFLRFENKVCYENSNTGVSVEIQENFVTLKVYSDPNCENLQYENDILFEDMISPLEHITDTFEYVGFFIPSLTQNCENEKNGIRRYIKSNCIKENNLYHKIIQQDNHLTRIVYSDAACTLEQMTIPLMQCGKCIINGVNETHGSTFVQCKAIETSCLIIFLLIVLFV